MILLQMLVLKLGRVHSKVGRVRLMGVTCLNRQTIIKAKRYYSLSNYICILHSYEVVTHILFCCSLMFRLRGLALRSGPGLNLSAVSAAVIKIDYLHGLCCLKVFEMVFVKQCGE